MCACVCVHAHVCSVFPVTLPGSVCWRFIPRSRSAILSTALKLPLWMVRIWRNDSYDGFHVCLSLDEFASRALSLRFFRDLEVRPGTGALVYLAVTFRARRPPQPRVLAERREQVQCQRSRSRLPGHRDSLAGGGLRPLSSQGPWAQSSLRCFGRVLSSLPSPLRFSVVWSV